MIRAQQIIAQMNDGYLNLSGLNLTTLPPLPANIVTLYVHNNNLTELPDIPNGVVELTANTNKLTKIPRLPASLRTADFRDNPLEEPFATFYNEYLKSTVPRTVKMDTLRRKVNAYLDRKENYASRRRNLSTLRQLTIRKGHQISPAQNVLEALTYGTGDLASYLSGTTAIAPERTGNRGGQTRNLINAHARKLLQGKNNPSARRNLSTLRQLTTRRGHQISPAQNVLEALTYGTGDLASYLSGIRAIAPPESTGNRGGETRNLINAHARKLLQGIKNPSSYHGGKRRTRKSKKASRKTRKNRKH
jgi:hypothetical protein